MASRGGRSADGDWNDQRRTCAAMKSTQPLWPLLCHIKVLTMMRLMLSLVIMHWTSDNCRARWPRWSDGSPPCCAGFPCGRSVGRWLGLATGLRAGLTAGRVVGGLRIGCPGCCGGGRGLRGGGCGGGKGSNGGGGPSADGGLHGSGLDGEFGGGGPEGSGGKGGMVVGGGWLSAVRHTDGIVRLRLPSP